MREKVRGKLIYGVEGKDYNKEGLRGAVLFIS